MTPDRWAEVERLYHAALARAVDERVAFLRETCTNDEALRREVESLLAESASGDLLAAPAIAVAAEMASTPGASVLTGRRIGVYQIHALLGAGGMGAVYRARDTKLGRDVAIKIYVRPLSSHERPLAGLDWGRHQAALVARWRELFYVSPANALLRVGVERAASWAATTATMLLKEGSVMSPAGTLGRTYDLSPDGQRFLVPKPASLPNAPPPQLVVVQHFDEMLERLVPTN